MDKKRYYRQTKIVSWLISTTKGDIWTKEEESQYIQPENKSKISSPLGIDLALLDMDDSNDFPFEEIQTIDVE